MPLVLKCQTGKRQWAAAILLGDQFMGLASPFYGLMGNIQKLGNLLIGECSALFHFFADDHPGASARTMASLLSII